MDTEGCEEAFKDVNRPNVESVQIVKNLQKKLEDCGKEIL